MTETPSIGRAVAEDAAAGDGVTLAGTIALIRADVRRRLTLEGRPATLAGAIGIALKPGVVCVVAFRLTNLLHFTGHRVLARILDDLQQLYTKTEIHAGCVAGPGLVVGDRSGGGVSEHVTLGRNCTLLGGSTMTLNADGIDLSRGRIVLGDHCVVGFGARVIGAVTLGDGVQVKPNAVVLNSAPTPGAVLDGVPARQTAIVPVDAVMRWNPLKSGFLPDGADAPPIAPREGRR